MGAVILDAADMRRTLGRMAHEILEANQGAESLAVIGILRRGWPLAKRLAFAMGQIEGVAIPSGKLSVASHRDDRPKSEEDDTEIPFEVTGKNVILVDEVMFTGRTARAALEALFAFGRPATVRLAVLVDRGHRQLPIQPDFCGKEVATSPGDHIRVHFAEYDGEDAVILEESVGSPA
ncbi:MAG: bifunctional pyr operon transcriptional regulator/uracil phosphoribosyltransferase PyrR [Armatimonadetes bacterium]|nr:bifunctional pyr operon transcriptional regulator/uracil phosphoribosyltransferase PyrR [Armatimonadota bacterium]